MSSAVSPQEEPRRVDEGLAVCQNSTDTNQHIRSSNLKQIQKLIFRTKKKEAMMAISSYYEQENNKLIKKPQCLTLSSDKMTVYPPRPAKDSITINREDYSCLGENQLLNDTFTSRQTLDTCDNTSQSPATRRHARVQKWTKNVNIFEKHLVIIPINEHDHWFLTIICFPGLVPVKNLKKKKK